MDTFSEVDWRWAQKYILAKRSSGAGIAQFCVALSLVYYGLQYKSHSYHRHAKYH